jgi:hypothetical protein
VSSPLQLGYEMAADESTGAGDEDELARIQFHSLSLGVVQGATAPRRRR